MLILHTSKTVCVCVCVYTNIARKLADMAPENRLSIKCDRVEVRIEWMSNVALMARCIGFHVRVYIHCDIVIYIVI
jgi:hypothetical protein